MSATMTVAEWLLSLGHTEVQPMVLTIEGKTYQGCRYVFTGEYKQGMQAVSNGEHTAGEKYQQTYFYFLGKKPEFRRKNFCFTCEGTTYYVSGYSQQAGDTDKNSLWHTFAANPFGPFFMLGIWPKEFGEIDQYEAHPYLRIPITLADVPHSNE